MKLPREDELPAGASVDRLIAACHRWRIVELALFGSFARGDATPTRDVDLMATFEPEARWSLFDHTAMTDDFAAIFGRPVDLVTKRAVESSENWIRRRAILESAHVVYAA